MVRRLLLLLVALPVVLALTTAPALASTGVSLNSQAAWNDSHVNVSGSLACEQFGSTVTVTVTQGAVTGTNPTVRGFDCDGAAHSFATTVAGAFQVGSAQATAVLRSPTGQLLAQTSRTITIAV